MTTNRSLRRSTLALAFVALVGTAFACTTEQSAASPRRHVAATPAPVVSTALTEDYLSDRAALLGAALHSADVSNAERTLGGRRATLASNIHATAASQLAL